MRSLFVVPCKYDQSNPVVKDCVARIARCHPHSGIVVVDSDSEDYYETPHAHISWTSNRNYAQGAYAYVVKHYQADVFYFLQDSVMVNGSLPVPDPFYTVRWFSDPPHAWGWDEEGASLRGWGEKMLSRMGIPCPDTYRGVFGPMWACTKEIVEELRLIGFWDILPENKFEQSALERVTGIVLEHLGYDVRDGSLQGQHTDHFGEYDSTYITKLNMARP